MQNTLQKIIEQGRMAGELDDSITSEEMTEFLFIAARGVIYNWCLREGGFDLTLMMRRYMERLVVTFRKNSI